MLGESLVLALCPLDFTEFDLQRIPYSSHVSIYKGVTLHASPTLDTNVWGHLQISGIHSNR
ncbi:hypothetical protein HpMS258_14200 [Helicobacter pylori]